MKRIRVMTADAGRVPAAAMWLLLMLAMLAPVEGARAAGPESVANAAERLLPMIADGEADARKSEAKRESGDSVGDHCPEWDPPGIPVVRHWLTPVSVASTPASAITVSPAIVHCPRSTFGAVPAGR